MRYISTTRARFLWTIMMGIVMLPFFLQPANALDSSHLGTTAQVTTAGAGLISKVAPGEFLPIVMKLLNFGSSRRIDVDVSYEIFDENGYKIYTSNETLAVETTASFVKTIQIPFETPPGNYMVKSFVTYKDQRVPATSRFRFVVERKILGLFESDFYLYGGATLAFGLAGGILGHLWVKRRRAIREALFDYSNIPHHERIFYEIISDTISHMRQHLGDRALDIALAIAEMEIDANTGRVLRMKKSPSKIIASLISEYEKVLGQKTRK